MESASIKSYDDLQLNQPLFLGAVQLSEKEIINFASAFDPLEFHTNIDAANKSMFKGLVASGAHIFTVIHKEKWIALFGKSVLAGLEINNWKFLKPVYVNQKIDCFVMIVNKKLNSDGKTVILKWLYEFKDAKTSELVQSLEMVILHRLE